MARLTAAELRQFSVNLGSTILGLFICILLAYVVVRLFGVELPPNNREIAALITGVVLREFSGMCQFFYGSSSDTKKQAETIDRLSKTNEATTAAALPQAPAVTLPAGESVTIAAKDDANANP